MKKRIQIAIAILIFVVGAVVLYGFVSSGSEFPERADTMCHIYKGEVLYNSIKEGNWYPLYDQYWYNGVQMMRYWAPMPVYYLAICQGIMGGDSIAGYYLFIASVFLLGGLVWVYIGAKRNRLWLGVTFGFLWFFLPNNLHALFIEGNLPRSLSMILLPLLVHFLLQYLYEGDKKAIKLVIPVFTGIVLCHTGYAGMIILAVLLLLLVYRLTMGKTGRCLGAIASLVLPFLLIGIWLLPSLKGGITSTDSSQVMKQFFQSAWVTLNPFERWQSDHTYFYFGLAAFLVAVFGILCSYKKNAICFITSILIFMGTTLSAYPLLEKMPGSQYLWMLRFISIALCFILFGLFLWDKLKKPLLAVCLVLLVLDVVPSLELVYSPENPQDMTAAMNEFSDNQMLTKARSLTKQRMVLMDRSTLAAMGAYLSTDFQGDRVAQTYGAGWQSASTVKNISMLNESMESGNYDYLFDRCLELGNDVVLIRKSELQYKDADSERVKESAQNRGYRLVDEDSINLLFKYEVEGSFGTVCKYSGIGIGTSAPNQSMCLPQLEMGKSDNIDDYTFEELKDYEVVFLSAFTYKNKTTAENLLKRLAASGVRVIINGDGIPTNEESRNQEFLGVLCHNIKFQNGYPILYLGNESYETKLFDRDYADWTSVYFTGLDEVQGFFYDNELKLDFIGKTKDNIYFVGLNITYHTLLTRDEATAEIFDKISDGKLRGMPQREVVPIEVVHGKDSVTVVSEYDNVNTSIAWHDNFVSANELQIQHRLVKVDKGITRIDMEYPYFWSGLGLSFLGVLGTIMFILWINKKHMAS